jgi:hypothetical protein
MAGGPEDHFTDGRWNWWLPDWAASSSASTRRPCRRRRPRSEAGIRVHLRSAEKGRHSPSQLERPVAQVVPREGRGRSASHPPNRLQGSQQTHPVDIPQEVVGSSRRSPAIPANHRDRTPAHGVIPVYPRPARNYQDRPVTPEVAGSSPVAPVKSLQIGIFFLPALAQSTAGFRPVTRSSRTRIRTRSGQRKALQIAMFCGWRRSQGPR